MKYKIGQILKIKNIKSCDSATSIGGKYVKITNYDTTYIYEILDINKNKIGGCFCFTDNDLEPIGKTWETLAYGDSLEGLNNRKVKVVGVIDEVVFLSDPSNNLPPFIRLRKQLATTDLKIIQDEPTPELIELTLEEVATKLGVDVKSLRIKEHE